MQESHLPKETPQSSSAAGDLLSLRNILMATDFSECSARALRYALGIAGRYEARLHLFHCVDPRPYNMVGPDAVQSACDASWRDMQRLDTDLRSSGLAKNIEIKLRVEVGDLAEILPGLVKELDLGLIVVGTHGRTGWRKMVLGSVTEIVVDQADCPVLTVGPSDDRTRLEQFGPEQVLFSSAPSAHSELAQEYAFSIARKYGSRLTVADVLEDKAGRVRAQVSQLEWREQESSEPESSDAIREVEPAGAPQLPAEFGTRADLVLRVADRIAADLIVLTVPASHGFADRFVPSIAYQVLCFSQCPVLTVRAR